MLSKSCLHWVTTSTSFGTFLHQGHSSAKGLLERLPAIRNHRARPIHIELYHLAAEFKVKILLQGGHQVQQRVFSAIAASSAVVLVLRILQKHHAAAQLAAEIVLECQIPANLQFQLISQTLVSCQWCFHCLGQGCLRSGSLRVFHRAAAECWEAIVCLSCDPGNFSFRQP